MEVSAYFYSIPREFGGKKTFTKRTLTLFTDIQDRAEVTMNIAKKAIITAFETWFNII